MVSTAGARCEECAASAPLPGLSSHTRSPARPAGLAPIHDQPPLTSEALARLSASLSESQMQISATPPDASGDASWQHVGMQLAGATPLGHPGVRHGASTRFTVCACLAQ